MSKLSKEVKLSIIILTYNCEKVIAACLESVFAFKKDDWEVIVIDNNSIDGTLEIVKKYPGVKVIKNSENLGFAGGNNLAVKQAKGKYILFLNPDTVVEKDSINMPLELLERRKDIGAIGVKILLGSGKLDYSCHRGFPTPWNSLCWFSGLTKLFPKNKLFTGYTLGYMDIHKPHEVDAITGAFLMMPKKLGDQINWFDEDFFWNGEDLDLCYRVKERGYKVFYLPDVKIWHYKGSSNGHKRGSKTFYARYEVMKLFYDKHYRNIYPGFVRWLVYQGINFRMGVQWLLG